MDALSSVGVVSVPAVGETLVVIGGDAGGMTAAANARRLNGDLDIVALEKTRWISYTACGIPYHVAGDVDDLEDLVVRTPQEFRDQNRIDVRLKHEALAIDTDAQQVEVRDHDHGRTVRLPYDQLLIGTGARPLRPDIPGINGESVLGVQTLGDAERVMERTQRSEPKSVVVVGGGYIGLEMAEAFLRRGAKVTVVDGAAEVMGSLDPDMGALVRAAMVKMGIEVRCGSPVSGFEPGSVHLESGDTLPADLVILGLGVVPNTDLAKEAGIETGVKGAIRVNTRLQASVEGVWAAGDCTESFHLVSRQPVHIALGTVANRQSRVAGINLGGGYATFPGVVGTAVTKVCATEVARTGLNENEADAAGLGYVVAKIKATTRAGYFPGTKPIIVKMLAEKGTGRLLGAQIVGEEGAGKRIDSVAVALTARFTAEELISTDLSYAPPFSPLWDPVQVAARQVVGQL
jgi:NADPH-dependent 2,4-dienoyl-CoA reductase/sulfur reductase-like enzyme